MRIAGLVMVLAAALPGGAADLEARIAAHPPKTQLAAGQAAGEIVSYTSGAYTLKGCVWRPKGPGPFPAILYNHGSTKDPGWQPELAAFYNARGFLVFVPLRHGHGGMPGDYINDLTERFLKEHPNDTEANWKEQVRLLELYNPDVDAALAWLKKRPDVDKSRIIVSGISYGGIQTILSAEKGLGVRGFIPFGPAAMSWANLELRKRLLRAVNAAKAPLFLVQAENDYSTGPTELLGAAIVRKGPPNGSKLYPPFGPDHVHGHGNFATWNLGTEIWGHDVLAFIDSVVK